MADFETMMTLCKRAILIQNFDICSWKNYTIKYYEAPYRNNEIYVVINTNNGNDDIVCRLNIKDCTVTEAKSRFEHFKEEECLIKHSQEILTKSCGLNKDKLQLIINFVKEFAK